LALDDLKVILTRNLQSPITFHFSIFQQHPVLGVMVLSGCISSCQLLYFTLQQHFSWPRK